MALALRIDLCSPCKIKMNELTFVGSPEYFNPFSATRINVTWLLLVRVLPLRKHYSFYSMYLRLLFEKVDQKLKQTFSFKNLY